MSERQNVEIDYCPQCRGIWLDRGELDKLIERSEQADPSQYGSAPRANRASERMIERPGPDFSDSDHYSDRKRYGGRKKSWLGEIFD